MGKTNKYWLERDSIGPDGFNKYGFGQDGYDRLGYDFDGYDRFGRNRNGFDREGYDRDGYDEAGFDKQGFDRDGIDRNGINRWGFDQYGDDARFPYYDKDGFDREGYDKEGYDKNGFDRCGYDRDGYDWHGINRRGYTRDGRNPAFEAGYSWTDLNVDDTNAEYERLAYGYDGDEVNECGIPLFEDDLIEDGPPEHLYSEDEPHQISRRATITPENKLYNTVKQQEQRNQMAQFTPEQIAAYEKKRIELRVMYNELLSELRPARRKTKG